MYKVQYIIMYSVRKFTQYVDPERRATTDMSLLKQIEDKGAVLEWSPIVQNANLVALGTKVMRSCSGMW